MIIFFSKMVLWFTHTTPYDKGEAKKVAFFSDFNNSEINRVNCGFLLKKLGWVVHA